MARRFLAGGRILCLMTKLDYEYLEREYKLNLAVLERRPRLVTWLDALLTMARFEDADVFLVSNDAQRD
jgi:hypothetical protein